MNQSAIPRFCPSCGGDRDVTAAFCEYCGRAFANAVVDGPDSNRAWIEAQRYIAAGDPRSADRCLDIFEQEAGASAEALALRAIIRLRSLRLDEARTLLDRALQLNPHSPFAHLKNAEYWLAFGVTVRALEELRIARKLAVGDDLLWAQVNRTFQAFSAKTRWSFARGRDEDRDLPQLASTTTTESNVPDRERS